VLVHVINNVCGYTVLPPVAVRRCRPPTSAARCIMPAVSVCVQLTLLAQPYAVGSDILAWLKCSISSSDTVQHSPHAEFCCTCLCPSWPPYPLCVMAMACLHHMTMLVFHGCGCSVDYGLCSAALGLTSLCRSISISSAVTTLSVHLALLEYLSNCNRSVCIQCGLRLTACWLCFHVLVALTCTCGKVHFGSSAVSPVQYNMASWFLSRIIAGARWVLLEVDLPGCGGSDVTVSGCISAPQSTTSCMLRWQPLTTGLQPSVHEL